MIGQTILHYRIVEKIGEGGMGIVYKAIDTHLDRPVAIKILPPEKVADPERKQRFVQEAKAASALNHPNIITIHDIIAEGGLDIMVMEFVEGRTLDQMIGRRGLKLQEALGYAIQAADGLAKAHSAGIIHRDIKPGNIMVNQDGLVKILDFGLAKLTEAIPAGEFSSTATLGKEAKLKTEEGYIVGTAAYMSPEQAEGKAVDARSDVFSFGAVLYEMLTGQKAFGHDSRIKTLAAVLNENPKSAIRINVDLPPEIDQILTRCLRKDPQRRWQTMSDLKVTLLDLKEDSESGKLRAAPPAARSGKRKLPIIAAGTILFLAAAAVLVRIFLFPPEKSVSFETIRLTFDSGNTAFPTISADGNLVAYASDRSGEGTLDIWVQQTAGGKPLRLTDHPADDKFPSISPDGSKIVFRSERDGGGLYVIDTLGGEARRIVDRGFFPKFSPDGALISYVDYPASGDFRLIKMFLMSSQGGAPKPFQPEFCGRFVHMSASPVWSPDSKHLIFSGLRPDNPESEDWWVAPVDGGPAVRTNALKNLSPLSAVHFPAAWSGKHIYYVNGTTVEGVNIYRVPIESGSWTIAGQVEPITSGAGLKYTPSVTWDGRIVFAHQTAIIDSWILAAQTDQGIITGRMEKLTQDLMAKFKASLSRDGTKVAFTAFGGLQPARHEVRVKNLNSEQETIIPVQGTTLDSFPRISPDGSRLSYRDFVSGKSQTFIVPSGSTTGRILCESCLILDFFTDSNFVLIMDKPNKLGRMDTRSGEKIPVLTLASGIINNYASLSPDDRWIAYVTGKPDGRAVISIAPLGAAAVPGTSPIIVAEEDHFLGSPKWSPNGRLLYFLSERDGNCCIYAQRLDHGTKKPIGEPFGVYHAHESRYGLNFPKGSASMSIAKDKIIFSAIDFTGNIYIAKPKNR